MYLINTHPNVKGALLKGQPMGFTSGYFRNILYNAASPTILAQISASESLASQNAENINKFV